jgi:proteic killer suppression protein
VIRNFKDEGDVPIQSFKDVRCERIFNGRHPGKGFPADMIRATARKLAMLNAATTLDDLRAPPANRLEALVANRAGQHAIRVNDQFRICFIWTPQGPESVEFFDCH